MRSQLTGSESPLVSVVVVNWNTRDLLERCLASVERSSPASKETMVVDNGSTDGSVEMVRDRWPWVELIPNPENVGYARANNQAIARARGRFVLLINADAELGEGSLSRMIELLGSHPDAAVVGPRLVFGDGSWQRWTAGAAPTLASAASHFLFLDRLLGGRAPRSVWLSKDVDTPFQPDWVSSACMLVRWEALQSVGGALDQTYFAYMDDVDLCRRLKEAGWGIWYEPRAQALHLMGASSRRAYGGPSPAALRNFNHYFGVQHGRAAEWALRAMEVLGFGIRAIVYLIASALRPELRGSAAAHSKNLRVSLQRGHF